MSLSSVDLRAILQLGRIPNVFTAVSNVMAGILLARGGELHASDWRLIACSALLYLSGMVFNDFFDRKVDAIERPFRPIPSARVSPRLACGLGCVLMAAAIVLIWPLGPAVQATAIVLAAAILLYDTWLKNTPLGAVSMGTCRCLNVLLGFAIAPWPAAWLFVLPVGLGFYTAVITYLARDEVVGLGLGRSVASARMMSALFGLFVVYLVALLF